MSFNGNKIITSFGGEALISDEKDMIDKARSLVAQARDSAPYYQYKHIGYNYRTSNILAKIDLGFPSGSNTSDEDRMRVLNSIIKNLSK